ncbi:hypothetical protein FDA94_26670 [Herbidospora galbida]|uniref:Secreted protein n=1 Tax=Herbidospora galbida TaxID=2575442 RepID=A0A4U3MCA3_9ACTN|nr:hypothetical protein [Herbidospora galbida]TKK85256.1 hypothetical protein FDA94_26670 [Herbidospora galbida]
MSGELVKMRRRSRSLRRLSAVIALIVVSVLATPQAAHAQSWQRPVKDYKWHCKTLMLDWRLTMAACTVINGTLAQAVGVVTSHTDGWLSVQASVWAYSRGAMVPDSSAWCNWAHLGPRGESACYGPTFSLPCGVNVQGYATMGYRNTTEPEVPLFDDVYAPTNPMCITT